MNAYEAVGRLRKATAITNVLVANGYRSSVVARFNDEQWGYAGASAGYKRKKPPSKEARAMVLEQMRAREDAPTLSINQINDRIQEVLRT